MLSCLPKKLKKIEGNENNKRKTHVLSNKTKATENKRYVKIWNKLTPGKDAIVLVQVLIRIMIIEITLRVMMISQFEQWVWQQRRQIISKNRKSWSQKRTKNKLGSSILSHINVRLHAHFINYLHEACRFLYAKHYLSIILVFDELCWCRVTNFKKIFNQNAM